MCEFVLFDLSLLETAVKGGRICLICHTFWPDTEALCPGCLKAVSPTEEHT
jgi:predicted amidophosphoribosyltransferase